MAFTVTTLAKTVFGNEIVGHFSVAADAAEANLTAGQLGFKNIISVQATIKTATTTLLPRFAPNLTSTSVAAPGGLGISGMTSGDVYLITIYGR